MPKNDYGIKKGEVLEGSGLLIKKKNNNLDGRVNHLITHMHNNLAYKNASDSSKIDDYKNRYIEYRNNWYQQPKLCIRDRLNENMMKKKGIIPLSIDIETAAVCDLACPFCFREYIATPDKLINSEFCFELIDQAAELGVPSIKFNWRGEPLLHPKLPEFIAYAKKRGILETIINTNATTLTKEKSLQLINAGLDFMIYSFDGGTKESYEKMRPGRFKENSFKKVYENIRRFHSIKKETGSDLPYTKIQMIMMEETYKEKNKFFSLFSDIVDDVTVTQYTERGGNISDIDDETRVEYEDALNKYSLPEGTPYMRGPNGKLYISRKRKSCEQPFQRLLITYEGRVGMCCFDWGAMHPVGYVKEEAFSNKDEYKTIVEKAQDSKNGFELLKEVEMPKTFNKPPKLVQSIKDIWYGEEIGKVRKKHLAGKVNSVAICKNCTFKDTYVWEAP